MHCSFMETLSTNLTCNVSTKDCSLIYVAQIEGNVTANFPVGPLQLRKVKSSFTLYLHIEFFPCRIKSHVIDRNQSESQFKTKHGS